MSTPLAHRPKLDSTTKGLAFLIVGMAIITAWDQWFIWSTKEDYNFGFLVPFFSAYVLWERWDELKGLLTGEKSLPATRDFRWLNFSAGTIGFIFLLLFVIGGATRAIFGTGVGPTLAIAAGFIGTTLSLTYLSVRGPEKFQPTLSSRWQAVGLMCFPAFVWIISGPFLYLVDNKIKGELLTNVTEIVSGFMRLAGETITVRGNTLVFANQDAVGIADACSGIRSLSACIFVGAFFGAIFLQGGFPGSLIRRVLLIVCAGFAAILINIARNTFLAFYALKHGSRSLEHDFWGVEMGSPQFSKLGNVHDFAGNASMVLAFLLLLACVPLINRLGRSTPLPSQSP
ncbi:MAG: exosortase/archaeosortase family protein [Verrucomicrobia bacterium]|nr:exosortase/archaeosortase family protein [Verrucomicrobiota bacterium]